MDMYTLCTRENVYIPGDLHTYIYPWGVCTCAQAYVYTYVTYVHTYAYAYVDTPRIYIYIYTHRKVCVYIYMSYTPGFREPFEDYIGTCFETCLSCYWFMGLGFEFRGFHLML